MRLQKGKWIMTALLGITMIYGLLGCDDSAKSHPEEGLPGGVLNRTDPGAPKVINSKEISAFYTRFYLATRWTDVEQEKHMFEFRVQPDENGVLTASEYISGIRFPADQKLLTALQRVIEQEKLAGQNGLYRLTAGLPPEYQECNLKVNYASGETLSFTVNNDPYAAWTEKIYTVFADWFADHGNRDLYPPNEASSVSWFDLEYMENGKRVMYENRKVSEDEAIGGQMHLLGKEVWDEEAGTIISEQQIALPEGYFAGLTAILVEYNFSVSYDFSHFNHATKRLDNHEAGYYGMGSRTAADDEADAENMSLFLYMEYESGRRVSVQTQKASEIEGMKPMLTDLLEYNASFFDGMVD